MDSVSKNRLAAIALLLCAVFLVFGRSLSHGFVFWDDDVHITQNSSVLSPSTKTTLAFWKKPHDLALTRTVWAGLAGINKALGRTALDPRLFHLTNVATHSLSVILVFLIALSLTGPGLAGMIAALIFGLHPLQTESVAWTSGLKELLSGFFALASMAAYIASEQETLSSKRKTLLYGLSFLAFAASLTSKTTSSGLPLALAALSLLRWKSQDQTPRTDASVRRDGINEFLNLFLKLLPFLLLSIAALLLSRSIQSEDKIGFLPSLAQRVILFGESFFFYVSKFFFPVGLIPHYDRLPQTVLASSGLIIRAILGGVIVLTGIGLWLVKRSRRWSFPVLIPVFFLLPVLGLIPFIYQSFSLTADRYAYLSLLGPALAVAFLLTPFRNSAQIPADAGMTHSSENCLKIPNRHLTVVQNHSKLVSFILLTGLLGILSFRQTAYWKDTLVLFTRTAKINPNSWVAYNNLGVVVSRSDPSGASAYFIKAIACRPEINPDLAVSHYNLGLAYARSGDFPSAEEHWTSAVQIRPSMTSAWNNLGILYDKQNRPAESLESFRRSLALEPLNPDILYRAAVAALRTKDPSAARVWASEAVRLRPDNPSYSSLLKQIH